jgi:hypothetical protein
MTINVTEGAGIKIESEVVSGEHRQSVNTRAKFDSGTFSNSDVDALEQIAEIPTSNARKLYLTFTTTVALAGFQVAFRAHASGAYFVIATTSFDYTTPSGPIIGASGDLTAAGPGVTHWLTLDVEGIESVRLQAASTNAVVAGHWGSN